MSFALHDALGVSAERGNELSALLAGLTRDPDQNMESICQKLGKDHDPEMLLLGAYIGLAVLENDERVVPMGYRVDVCAIVASEPGAAD